ncbi:NAD(P)-binding protein [Trametes coccinea BRFM310]|uniref:NAD(P)-binding protein n=1 Tax=Trametes coccinea (strain BRFM310) TaxID=1353009 RepID=A0A1Y2ICS0_TRAC3|nr:NAD(P)-binding protein [Trametes coccinea BRFM310]
MGAKEFGYGRRGGVKCLLPETQIIYDTPDALQAHTYINRGRPISPFPCPSLINSGKELGMAKQELVWFVTGASKGLGLALTKRILARGDRVVATARNPRALEPLLADPATDRTRIFVLELDVTSPAETVRDTVSKAVEHWGRVDVLVNNAGMGGGVGPSEEQGVEHMMEVMRTNYMGTLNVTHAFLPHMRERRSGTILLFGSRTAYRNEFVGPSAYAASKAAVHAYGETLRAELAPFNVRVSVVVPGYFDSGLALPLVGTPIADYDAAREELKKRVAMRDRLPNPGDPEKGMEAIVDVVRGEGRAASHAPGVLPTWLFLGGDCLGDVKARAEKLTQVVDAWKDVGSGLGKEDPAWF